MEVELCLGENSSKQIKAEVTAIKDVAVQMILVVWGDWNLWMHGRHKDASLAESVVVKRHDDIREAGGNFATTMGVPSVWLHNDKLGRLELTKDKRHFEFSAKTKLKEISYFQLPFK